MNFDISDFPLPRKFFPRLSFQWLKKSLIDFENPTKLRTKLVFPIIKFRVNCTFLNHR